MESLKYIKKYLNYIIKLEEIQDNLDLIREITGKKENIPWDNKTDHPDRSIITPEIKEFIDTKYSEDFTNFGYEKVI